MNNEVKKTPLRLKNHTHIIKSYTHEIFLFIFGNIY